MVRVNNNSSFDKEVVVVEQEHNSSFNLGKEDPEEDFSFLAVVQDNKEVFNFPKRWFLLFFSYGH